MAVAPMRAASPVCSVLAPRWAAKCDSRLRAPMRRRRSTRSPPSSPARARSSVARLDRAAIITAISAAVGATPDPEGTADLIAERGHLNVAASAAEVKSAVGRLAPLRGYRWIVINAGDLF